MITGYEDKKIKCINFDGAEDYVALADMPDECPICHVKISPTILKAYQHDQNYGGYDRYEILFKCTNQKCRHLFIAYYRNSYPGRNNEIVHLDGTGFVHYLDDQKFPEMIKEISKQFPEIYNQALSAEKNGLNEICGPGYGKALEFLVKDYLIHLLPSEKNEISEMWLGQAIKKIDEQDIKAMAERAAWLRNDESHYLRRFDDMDVAHLKDLILIMVNFIEIKEKAKEYLKMKPKK